MMTNDTDLIQIQINQIKSQQAKKAAEETNKASEKSIEDARQGQLISEALDRVVRRLEEFRSHINPKIRSRIVRGARGVTFQLGNYPLALAEPAYSMRVSLDRTDLTFVKYPLEIDCYNLSDAYNTFTIDEIIEMLAKEVATLTLTPAPFVISESILAPYRGISGVVGTIAALLIFGLSIVLMGWWGVLVGGIAALLVSAYAQYLWPPALLLIIYLSMK